jgi:hypothetical protein
MFPAARLRRRQSDCGKEPDLPASPGSNAMNRAAEAAHLAAKIALAHKGIPRAVTLKVAELSDGGLSNFEISARMGLPLPMVNLILRGGAPGVPK